MRGAGRVVFAAVLLLIAGTLNIIYGIGAIGDANFYTGTGTHYVFANLHTWGWITLILGVIQLTAGVLAVRRRSLRPRDRGHRRHASARSGRCWRSGRVPFWSLGVFAICLWVAYGLIVFGERGDTLGSLN